MVKIVTVVVMIATAIITSVVYHTTQKADIEYYQGRRYFEKGEYSKAATFYRKALTINSSHIKSLKDIGRVYQWTGKHDQAIEAFRKILSVKPEDSAIKMALAETLSWRKRYPEAIALFKQVIDATGDTDATIELAEVYQWEGQFEKSKETLGCLPPSRLNEAKPRFLLARALLYTGDVEKAAALLGRLLLERAPGSEARLRAEIEKLLAEASMMRKDYADAIKRYRKQIEEDPRDIKSRIMLADMLSWAKCYDEAITEYTRALEIDPGNTEVRARLARVCSWVKEYARAEALLKEVLAADSGDAASRILLAEILSWQKKYDASIAEYERLLTADPDNLKIKESVARVYLWNKKYDRAERLYREIVAVDPSNTAARLALGELLLYSADYSGSRDIFNGIIAIEPDNVEARVLLADSYAYDKDFKRAVELYNEALKLRDDRTTKRKLADTLSWDKRYDQSLRLYDELLAAEEDRDIWLQKARVLGWARRYPEALGEYRILADKTGDPVVLLEMEAKGAYWDDRVEGAISNYGALIKKSPDNVEAMFDLSQIYSYQSMWEDAIGEYHRILKSMPSHFRAAEGLEKADLIAHHLSWEPDYGFYESDSPSRDSDIRRHTIVNKFSLPVNYHIRMDGAYSFTARSFADFPDVVENEGEAKISYIFNPRAWVDGFYDIISYNRDISPIHMFGGSAHLRIIDAVLAHFWYKRERLENTSTVIRSHYYSDDFKERLDVSVDKRLKLGVDYLYSSVSDDNRRWEPGFDILYYLSLDPLRLTVKYRYFYREFEKKDPYYFSPKGFTTNSVALNWRHYLNKEEIFFGANDLYYDAGYTFTVDSTSIVGHQFTGGIHWDINKRLSLDVNGGFTVSSNNVYRESVAKASLKYYY